MIQTINKKMTNLLAGRDFKVLLISLLGLIGISSIVTETTSQIMVINLLFTIVLIIASNCLLLDLTLFYWSISLGFLAVFLTWMDFIWEDDSFLTLLKFANYSIFFSLLLVHILRTLFFAKKINLNIVFAAMSGYIIIGLIGCFLMLSLTDIYPNAYAYTNGRAITYFDYIYFSFVNLTTLGFGDLLPKIPPAKGLTILLTLIGQLYLSVIMAIMVGKYISESFKN